MSQSSEASWSAAPLNWPAVIMFALTIPLGLIVAPLYILATDPSPWLYAWAFGLFWLTGISITAGYHRYWAHRSYRARAPLRWFLMLFGGMALQNSILVWASMHRVHHRHVDDTESDPYSIKRGFWFAHMGWMLRDYPSGDIDTSGARDLESDPLVAFQHRYYVPLAVGMNLLVPGLIGALHGDIIGGLLIAGALRLVLVHQITFFINSLAHYWGKRPFTRANTARDNGVIALLTFGEGYHNFHHLFQWDYRNGIRWWQFDPTKWLIAGAARVGLASDLKRVPEFKIQRALLETQLEHAQARAETVELDEDTRLAHLRRLLEQEADALRDTVSAWARCQQERLQMARQELSHRWERSELSSRVHDLESSLAASLREQRQRVGVVARQLARAAAGAKATA
ncbi:fatty acid desaturase [Algiphilus sp.]|uniref:fatty acid desaturase n=1 Tax=Algiphilus sp. TaxID=1872431 RepID=UPI001CA69F8E|nr:fatty acid desaturase [Algiphilus acroporae]MCR9091364.1 fatty acid desaturase [Pseudomonadota bacterium]